MSQCPYQAVHCAISTQKRQFLTRLKQLITIAGGILAILTTASTTTKERECVSHNNRNVNIAVAFQFFLLYSMYIAVYVTPGLFVKHLLK